MNAKEIIEYLKDLPPETPVIIRGYEEGYNNILHLIQRKIIPHPEQKARYYGEFNDAHTANELASAVYAVELFGENTKKEY